MNIKQIISFNKLIKSKQNKLKYCYKCNQIHSVNKHKDKLN
jgi:hypothetical protein